MLKSTQQISCQLSQQTSLSPSKLELNANKITPEIIRPKPRRVVGQQSGPQLSRHCTSSDLSQMNARTSPVRDQLMVRPNTPLSPFRRDAVGGSAPVLTHITNRSDGSPKFSLSPFQSSSPLKNVSGRESAGSGISQAPQKSIKPIRETPPIKPPLSHPKPRNGTPPSKIYEQLYFPSKSVNAINENDSQTNESGFTSMNHLMKESPSTTECGSLSKSSSDGDHIINKKKVLSKMKSRRRNILCFASPATVVSDDNNSSPRVNLNGKVRQGCYGGSSSDENRSSGHASMSDTRSSYFSSSPTDDIDVNNSKIDQLLKAELTQNISNLNQRKLSNEECVNQFIINKHSNLRKSGFKSRKREPESIFNNSCGNSAIGQLDCVRVAIEQMSLRQNGGHSTSTYSSNYSGSDYEKTFPRLIRHSSLETIGTNITSAVDDFVWIDSHSRLVELQHYPWNNHDVLRLLQQGRLKNQLNRISMESVPRLSYLLQRPLVRIASEAQRFARSLGMCTKHEICGAIKVVLCTALADSCIKSGHRAAAIFAVSGPDNFRQSKSVRAGLQFSVGKFHRWMSDVKMGNFVDEYAAIYLTSAIENLLEEIILQCLSMQINEFVLTANLLDTCIANNSDLWGLLQPFAHLNAGRTANGMLSLPSFHNYSNNTLNDSNSDHKNNPQLNTSKTIEQQLLTTCVGSVQELGDILNNVSQYRAPNQQSNRKCSPNWWSTHSWSAGALYSLYYYMRCAQLEHSTQMDHQKASQELVYERPYLVLPPLYEWLRVSSSHANYRKSSTIDKDDVLQAARILLPGIDCPPRQINYINSEEWIYSRKEMDKNECARRLKIELAFRMLSCGRTDLLSNALQLLPANYGINTINDSGLTILMQSCIGGDQPIVQRLCESGVNVNIETPIAPNNSNSNNRFTNCHIISETQHWTALNYATIHGHFDIAKMLLEKGANVEGGARYGEDRVTQTPLQLASSSGRIDLVKLLLSYGADPFLSTSLKDSMSHCGASRGCPSAIAVAAIHGERMILRTLLAHPLSNASKDVLSLEEMLAESSANYQTSERRRIQVVAANQDPNSSASVASDGSEVIQLTKSKLKALQEAMYHSAENGFLEITLDLRNIGVSWTLHCWMQTLANAHEMRLDAITDQLLQDFLHLWPDDCSSQFVDECLPLLFSIFRHSKNEGTSLLLADIFSTCYGKERVKQISNVSHVRGARIDAKYVNNKEMSDCMFKVENRLFYAHKIILVNASPRFQSMLTIKNTNESNNNSNNDINGSQQIQSPLTPIVINDIKYDIFQIVMQFLYNGGFDDFEVEQNDILELMSAANYFQLDALLRYCELRCSNCVDLDNVVSIYIHAKVYNAVQLLEYCQGFILQNLVALLTYDDAVRKLIFGKKLHNHDVLSGLLFTLQSRIKERHSPPKNHYLMKRNQPII